MSCLEKVKSYLGKTVRIKISDNRVIEGEFQCMDKDFNFMLGGAIEYHVRSELIYYCHEYN